MLLSFAQFEREVTAERIRDKVAASKRKGLWMGGRVPLGYEKDERTLRINEAEAETVRTLYALYRKHGTLRQVKADADRLRLRTKRRFAADGARTGGLPFRRGHLHCLLTNPLYAGRIRHQRRVYEGQHPSIIAPELWDAVQNAAAGRGCQTKETHDEGPCSPFPTGRQALRRDRGPADAEPHQKEKRATAPLLRLPAPHPAQWPKGPLRLATARPDAGTEIATEDAIPTDRVRKAIRYAFLAPDIVRAIVEGRQPVGLTSSYLLHHPLPDDWEKQRVLVRNAVSLPAASASAPLRE